MRYYKAVLCTCDKDLRYLKSGYVNLIDIHENLNIHRDDLIIKVDDDGNATECRINEEITFLNFMNRRNNDVEAIVSEDFVTTFALSVNHEIKEEDLKHYTKIDGYQLEIDVAMAKRIGDENLRKTEVKTKKLQRLMKKFD